MAATYAHTNEDEEQPTIKVSDTLYLIGLVCAVVGFLATAVGLSCGVIITATETSSGPRHHCTHYPKAQCVTTCDCVWCDGGCYTFEQTDRCEAGSTIQASPRCKPDMPAIIGFWSTAAGGLLLLFLALLCCLSVPPSVPCRRIETVGDDDL